MLVLVVYVNYGKLIYRFCSVTANVITFKWRS